MQRYKRPVVRRYVSNNGTGSTVSARSFAVRVPLCVYPSVFGFGCQTLAAVNSLQYLIGHWMSQLYLLSSGLSQIRLSDGAKLERPRATQIRNKCRTMKLMEHIIKRCARPI